MSCDLDRQLHESVMKREMVKERTYRAEQERKEAEREVELGFGGSEMTEKELRKIIDSDRRMYYRTVELNDKLYMHYKGWKDLKNLDGWTGLRCLYAECNAFDRIQGLHNCRQLRSLFLQENCITHISGLDSCPDLWNLNLSNNFITRIEGLENLTRLNTLIIAKNRIGNKGVDDVIKLVDTPINSLDIQDNLIWDPDVLPEVIVHMTNLKVLYLKGNPCAKKIPNYRKTTTVYCKNLTYLDDRPVFEDDRRTAEAFNRGGLEEERAERKRIREEAKEKHDRNMAAFSQMVEDAKKAKLERKAMREEDKYSEADDPGLGNERRMKRQTEEWQREHAEELRDDAKDHAERCLKAEKEAREKGSTSTGYGDKEHNSDAKQEVSTQSDENHAETEPETKKDRRTLVYEDIWDEGPPPPSLEKSVAAMHQPNPQGGDQATPIGLPEARSPLSVTPGRGQSADAENAASKACASGSWYAKYQENVNTRQAHLSAIIHKERHKNSAACDTAPEPVHSPLDELGEMD